MDYRPFTTGNAAMLLMDYQTGTMQLIRNRFRDQVHRNGILLARLAARLAATTAGASLTPQQHWVASVVFSVLLGSAAILLAGPFLPAWLASPSGGNTA
ncbi:MAG: hypothetical protein M3Z75_00490 [Actinomycetota bacterium]|nr:hypothetical protein [Actinomycetota bacterium]